MFLNYLSQESKETFLKLSILASKANGLFVDEEKELIYAYCREMSIPEVLPDVEESVSKILSQLSDSIDDVEKNIIVLETLGLVRADGIYDEKEKQFMQEVIKGIKVKKDILPQYNSLLNIYDAIIKEIQSAICEVE